MSILKGYGQQALVDVLHNGMMDPIRKALKQRLMESLEKEVDEAVDTAIRDMKGYVEGMHDYHTGNVVFNVMIKHKDGNETRKTIS